MLVRYLRGALFFAMLFSFVWSNLLWEPSKDYSAAAENQTSAFISFLRLSANSCWATALLPTLSPQFRQGGLEGSVQWLQDLMKIWQHSMAASGIVVWWKKIKIVVNVIMIHHHMGAQARICSYQSAEGGKYLCACVHMHVHCTGTVPLRKIPTLCEGIWMQIYTHRMYKLQKSC